MIPPFVSKAGAPLSEQDLLARRYFPISETANEEGELDGSPTVPFTIIDPS